MFKQVQINIVYKYLVYLGEKETYSSLALDENVAFQDVYTS